ncbi:MAG: carboxypeptidase-like regulatory domain-containing protein [Ferruginibacter sp.]|nr:carboxypeptidase-like regulatory domain-containing protein [Chitinophagaceae bacterium]
MKKMPAFLFSLLLVYGFSFSQPVIKGRVVNGANSTPVPGSSVFINNTSKGTTTDKNGYFELNDISSGKHELIISSIGYETMMHPFSAEQLPLQLRIELAVKVKELKNVTVEPYVEEGWAKWGKVFMENFMGRTPNAAHCKIKNEKTIRFRYYKKSNRVVAYSDEPLILENKALGYRISYQMEDFEVNFKTGVTLFAGYPFFEEIDKSRKGLKQRWGRNRGKAYYGSMTHFMYSLYHDSLQQQGFEVRRMSRVPNKEKERVKRIYPRKRVVTMQMNGITITRDGKNDQPQALEDSSDYYDRIMQQKDYLEIYGLDLLTEDSLILREDGEYKILFFTDYLYITYKNEMEDPDYILQFGERRSPVFQRSYISMPGQNLVAIDKKGSYYPPQEIFSSAYWGWSEKMADCLPSDYKP